MSVTNYAPIDRPPSQVVSTVDALTVDYPSLLSPSQIRASYAQIAEFTVVGRDLPHPRGADEFDMGIIDRQLRPASPPPPASALGQRQTSRDIRLMTNRVVKGTVPDCLELDVPGGAADGHLTVDPATPAVINVGDRLVGFWDLSQGAPKLTLLATVGADGTATVPFSQQSPLRLGSLG